MSSNPMQDSTNGGRLRALEDAYTWCEARMIEYAGLPRLHPIGIEGPDHLTIQTKAHKAASIMRSRARELLRWMRWEGELSDADYLARVKELERLYTEASGR